MGSCRHGGPAPSARERQGDCAHLARQSRKGAREACWSLVLNARPMSTMDIRQRPTRDVAWLLGCLALRVGARAILGDVAHARHPQKISPIVFIVSAAGWIRGL